MSPQVLAWILFHVFIIAMLALDLGVFHKRSHVVKIKESLIWSGVWVTFALLFCAGVYYFRGTTVALQFLAGYLIEQSLSIDNLFVFLLIFSYFRVPEELKHRVLFWGIIGALVMRVIFIFAGISLLETFDWIFYIFGAFLIYTSVKLALHKGLEIHPEHNPLIKVLRKIVPVTNTYHGKHFFIVEKGRYVATLLFVVLLTLETTDLIFALDSIPAIFAITTDPFIVYTSNVFAILGLRSLFFALSGMMDLFHHLHYGLAFILCFIGIKMLIVNFIHIPIIFTLSVIIISVIISIIASILDPIVPKKGK